MQQQEARCLGIAGLAVEDFVSIDDSSAVMSHGPALLMACRNARQRTEHLSLAGRLRLIHLDATGWLLRIIYEYGSLPWVLHSFSSFWFLADRSRNQLTGAGRARNRVTSRSRRSTKRGCLARCLAHTSVFGAYYGRIILIALAQDSFDRGKAR